MANEIVGKVIGQITMLQKEQGLKLPPDYSASNALSAAYLELSDDSKGDSMIQKMNRGDITSGSVVKALTSMAIQGLSVAKNQGYFIQYGKSLSFTRSYFGSVAVVARQAEVKRNPFVNVIHQDDDIEIDTDDSGRMVVKSFTPRFENLDKPIVGAYAVIEFVDGHKEYTIMTKKEIEQSWSHRKNRGQVQQEFPQEMAKRTVLNRAAKMVINTSSDSDLMIDGINKSTEDEFENRKDVTPRAKTVADLLTTYEEPFEESEPDTQQQEVQPQEVAENESNEGRYQDPSNLFENPAK